MEKDSLFEVYFTACRFEIGQTVRKSKKKAA